MVVIKTFCKRNLENIAKTPCFYDILFIYLLLYWIVLKVQYEIPSCEGTALGRCFSIFQALKITTDWSDNDQ